MEAKDYLGQIGELTLQVNDLFEKLEELNRVVKKIDELKGDEQ